MRINFAKDSKGHERECMERGRAQQREDDYIERNQRKDNEEVN